MRAVVGVVAAIAIGGCHSDPCPDPIDDRNVVVSSVRDPVFIEREGARMLDAGPTDACSGWCAKCDLGTVPAHHPIPVDAGAPDTSPCPGTIPDEGAPCSGPMKCTYAKGEDLCTAACNDFDERRTWSVGCAKPTPPAVPTCPPDRPPNAAPCTRVGELCRYPATGVCIAMNVQCTPQGWFAEECLASATEARALGCYGALVCPSIE